MTKKIALGVLASGSGSNVQSLIDQIEAGKLAAEIRILLCNNPDAFVLERCRRHGIAACVVDHRDYPARELFDRRIVGVMIDHGVELVVMAGFMRILSAEFFRAFPNRILNIHPSLLPAFPGTHVQKQALDYGVRFSGCTVHFADEGVDTGPIIIQAVVPVDDRDTPESLSERILKEEHRIYPQAIQLFAEGRLEIRGRRVRILDGSKRAEGVLHNPPLSG